ncbi:MAG: CvpA family protein [Chloroflexota bacterium]
MNVGEAIVNFNRFDLLFLLFLFGMFVLGFMQGTIRRLLGLGSMLFSFLFAANLSVVIGPFLAANWNQFPDEYARMLGFLIVFGAASVAFTLIIQAFYHRQPLFPRYNFVDEVIGGILGIIQGAFFLGVIIVILDSYFLIPGAPKTSGELPFLRGFFDFYNDSATAQLFRSQLIPGFYNIFGLFIPSELKAFYTSPSSPPAS